MKKRTKAYLALLTSLLYLGGAALSVQETQARNVYTMNWNTVVDSSVPQVSSVCLVGQNDPALTVLTGTMSVHEQSHTITFPIHAGAAAAGSLLWSTEEGEFLDVALAVNGIDLTGVNTSLVPGENTVTITLTPSAQAREEIVSPRPAAIEITWTDGAGTVLTGTFQIMLENIPVEVPPTEAAQETQPEETETVPLETEAVLLEDTDPTEETQPGEDVVLETTPETIPETTSETTPETNPETTEPAVISKTQAQSDAAMTVQQTEPEESEPETEPTDVTRQTEPETTAPVDPGHNAAEPTVPGDTEPTAESTEETRPEETTVPGETETTAPEESTAPEETDAPTEGTQDTEPSEPETQPEETEAEAEGFRISSISSFSQTDARVPVQITLEEGIDTVKLGLTPSSDGLIQPLPRNTRFSVNDGESFYMMYGETGYVAEFSIPAGIEELPVLLDFSQTETELGSITLTAQGFAGKASRQSGSVTLIPTGETEVLADRLMAAADGQPPAEAWDTLFLSKDTQLQFTLPAAWNEADLDYSIEILAVDDYGRVGYTPASTADGSLIISHRVNEAQETVTVTMGDTLPGAGTYRANFQWSYEGIHFAQKEVTFFINYSAYAEQAQSGQEVQDNE